ncbi:hypothetical protein U1Q18_023331 [Sarracenia purpurea var. burkii]
MVNVCGCCVSIVLISYYADSYLVCDSRLEGCLEECQLICCHGSSTGGVSTGGAARSNTSGPYQLDQFRIGFRAPVGRTVLV